jgi:hypothetical protein
MMSSNVSLNSCRPEIMEHDRRDTLFSNLMRNSLGEGHTSRLWGSVEKVSRLRAFAASQKYPIEARK